MMNSCMKDGILYIWISLNVGVPSGVYSQHFCPVAWGQFILLPQRTMAVLEN